jgi:hypothetical protein
MGVSKFPRLELLQLCGIITSCVNLRLGWSLKKTCSLCWELSNGVSHATFTQGNWVDSWLFVVGNQIANLTLDLSFGHNLCFICPNGSCKPILDINVSIYFQWSKEILKDMCFDLYNRSLKIWESTGTPTPQNGSSLGSVSVHSHILPHSRVSLFGWVLANPCLGHKPKARCATCHIYTF